MPGSPQLATKPCATCGRPFAWRKKWARCWDSVRYCSDHCRRHKPAELDRRLESAIMDLLARRGPKASVCPSEAARAVDPEGWRDLLERTRSAARRLAARGEIVVTQGGGEVDPATARGPVRLALARPGGRDPTRG